jgi:hypothetical protein
LWFWQEKDEEETVWARGKKKKNPCGERKKRYK